MNTIILLTEAKDEFMNMPFSKGAIYSLFAILMVFAVLLIIIGLTTLIFKMTGLFDLKKELNEKKKEVESTSANTQNVIRNVNIEDDDMMAAVLVATIDYRNEIKQDVRLVNVRKVN